MGHMLLTNEVLLPEVWPFKKNRFWAMAADFCVMVHRGLLWGIFLLGMGRVIVEDVGLIQHLLLQPKR